MGNRLLYLIGELRAGGSERQLYYLLRAMDREVYQPEVVVWNFRETDMYVPKIRSLAVGLYSLPSPASRYTKLRKLREIVLRSRPAILHSYSFYTNFAAFWAAFGLHCIAIGAVRSDLDWAKADSGPILGRLSARWPRTQIFNNATAANCAEQSRSYFTPKRRLIVRNGVDLQTFRVFPLRKDKPIALGVGSLFEVKRWDRLILAAVALKQRGLEFLIEVIGAGPLRKALCEQTEKFKIADRIQFIGHADDIPQRLARASFLVHPADKEGSPNAVMEAMACGRAVVATDVGDIPNLIEHRRTGFVVARGDDSMLINSIANLITDRDLCYRMGMAGRIKAEQEFGLDRLVTETFAAYGSAGWRQV